MSPAASLLRRSVLLLVCLLAPFAVATPAHWLADIDAFTQADAKSPPPTDAVLFIGSSSIRLWTTLAADFPDLTVINRGFGGSELADSVFYADRIALPYQPRAVVLYAGDNDLSAGKSAEQVADDFAAFRLKIRTTLPTTHLYYLSIKLSGARAHLAPEIRRANALIAADCAAHPHCTFVDVATPLLDANGLPRLEYFRPDHLHLSPAGYAVWIKILTPLLKP